MGLFKSAAHALRALVGVSNNSTTGENRVAPPISAGYSPTPTHHWGNAVRDLPPFSQTIISAMLMDPTIRLGLAMREAPLFGAELTVECDRSNIKEFVVRQLKRIWSELDAITPAQVWGWSAGEVTYRLTSDGLVEIDRLLPRQSRDVRVLARQKDGEPTGVRILKVKSAENGRVDLDFPRSWWHAYKPEPGLFYGQSVLFGAYSPWWDKWMNGGALDVRRLFMHKDAYGGVDLGYPEGSTEITGKGPVPNRDIARQIAEQIKAGGVTSRPSGYDDNGNEMWPLTRATVPSSPTHILDYPKDLDVEELRGMEIPDDVLTAEATGAWEGKKVPMGAFYSGLDSWLKSIIRDMCTQIIDQLVELNFGKGNEYTVTPTSLVDQAMEQFGEQEQSQQQQPQTPTGQRMSLDPVEAVGRGVLDAAELVKAAKGVITVRMSSARAPKGGVSIGGKFYPGGKFIPGASQDEVDKEASRQTGMGFASPNVKEGMKFEGARKALDGERHKAMRKNFESIDESLELTQESFDVIGDWGDGAENSIITQYTEFRDHDELTYAMAMKGKIADQKAVLVFSENESGDDSVYRFEVDDTIEGVRDVLAKEGIDFRSVGVDENGRPIVFIVDFGNALTENIQNVGARYETEISQFRGHADQVGVDSEFSRKEAHQEYDRVIQQYEEKWPDRPRFKPTTRLSSSRRHQDARRSQHRPVVIGLGLRSVGGSNA